VTTDADHPPDQMLVTIGISTYNRVDGTLPAALRSALDQTYRNVEVVVCDNASEDGTQAFVEAIDDPRLRYVRHAVNIGANGNFNACLEAARGTYFLLLHDDDLLEPDFVERAMRAVGDREPGVVLGGVRLIDGDGAAIDEAAAPPTGETPAALFRAWFDRTCSFYFCSTLFHTERLRAFGGFASPENLFQDVVAIARLSAVSGYVSVPGVAASFRRHDGNLGGASHASRWCRDAVYLLDLLTETFPAEATELRAHGARYLSQKCYRYVASVPSFTERWRLYDDIHNQFDRAYAPWRYVGRRLLRRPRRRVSRWLAALRGTRARHAPPSQGLHGG